MVEPPIWRSNACAKATDIGLQYCKVLVFQHVESRVVSHASFYKFQCLQQSAPLHLDLRQTFHLLMFRIQTDRFLDWKVSTFLLDRGLFQMLKKNGLKILQSSLPAEQIIQMERC